MSEENVAKPVLDNVEMMALQHSIIHVATVILGGLHANSVSKAVSDVVVAKIANSRDMSGDEISELVRKVRTAFEGGPANLAVQAESTQPEPLPPVEKATPAQIRKSITPEALISFIDGKPYKTLKRHVGTHGLDPAGYRQRYGLPPDYPMVSPNYAAQRSELARSLGLGQNRRGTGAAETLAPTTAQAPEPVQEDAPAATPPASTAPPKPPRVRKPKPAPEAVETTVDPSLAGESGEHPDTGPAAAPPPPRRTPELVD